MKATKAEETKKFTQVSFDYLLDLGFVEQGQEVTVETVKSDQKFKVFEAYTLNMRVLQEVIDLLSETTLDITDYGENYISGNISMKERGMLVVSVPMEKGWTLYVNGTETPLETFKDAFMTVPLDAGTYELEWKFKTPGQTEGMLISIVCIALWAGCLYMEKKR